MKRSGHGRSPASANARVYRNAFILRAHQLLKLGYDRLNPASFSTADEETITGELVREMEEVLDFPPRGFRHLTVRDESRINASGRTGKRRLRVDIRVDSTKSSPRPRFYLEAKRLNDTHPLRDYLGPEGLGAFLTGEYAARYPTAGMLGYV